MAKRITHKGTLGGRDPQNDAMRREAHQELDALINLAEDRQQYGTMAVDVHFEAGVIQLIQTRLTRATKPATT